MTMGDIPFLTDFGPTVLLGVVVLLILSGKLIPRRNLDDTRADAEKWRRAYENAERARVEGSRQRSAMIDLLDFHTKLLQSIRDAAEERGQ